jgi:hypothetical protein
VNTNRDGCEPSDKSHQGVAISAAVLTIAAFDSGDKFGITKPGMARLCCRFSPQALLTSATSLPLLRAAPYHRRSRSDRTSSRIRRRIGDTCQQPSSKNIPIGHHSMQTASGHSRFSPDFKYHQQQVNSWN